MTAQVRHLVALRWRMLRRRRVRLGFAALAVSVPALVVAAVVLGLLAPAQRAFDVTLLAPSAYLSVAVIAVVAPLIAGGGNELFPESQLVAFPVTVRTTYLTSLALTPLNLAWTTQLIGLMGLTAYITAHTPFVILSLVLCAAYIALVTVAGQAGAWLVVGLRQRRRGRVGTWLVAGALGLAGAVVVATGSTARALDAAPTTYVVIAALNSADGNLAWWSATFAALVALTVLCWFAASSACDWAVRQPGGPASTLDSRTTARRSQPPSVSRALLRADRASVWRSVSLRRGLLVLGAFPGVIAAAAGLDWPSLVLLPGLVAAGAGLLFGVNAFSLDGSGIVWLAAQPHPPAAAFWAKTRVVAEVCCVAVLITVVAGSLRTGRWPSSGEAAALVAGATVAVARVVALCMTLSVRRPHRADLRGPRDTPAPPGVMAAYSARLAVSTTLIALVFAGLAEFAAWTWSVALALPLVLLSCRRLLRAQRAWERPVTRARVVTVVAGG